MNIKTNVLEFINREILNNLNTIEENQELLVSGILDSLSIMRVVSYLERETGITIPPIDIALENFSSVNAMCNYLDSK
jgi:acyl carrier protein